MPQNYSLPLPYGVKVLNPKPVDPRKECDNLDAIKNDGRYYVGFTGIANLSEPDGNGGFVKYDIVGGSAATGWVFEITDKLKIVHDTELHNDTPIWQAGSFLQDNGTIGASSNYSYTTNYLRVTPNSTRIFNGVGTSTVFIIFYDINKVKVGTWNIPGTAAYRSVVVPADAYYARLSNRHDTISNDKIVFEDLNNLPQRISRSLSRANLASLSLHEQPVWTEDSYVNVSGALSGHADYSYSQYIRVAEGATMKFNGVGSSGGLVGIAFYDINNIWISSVPVLSTSETEVEINIPYFAYYARISNRHSVLPDAKVYFEISGSIAKMVKQIYQRVYDNEDRLNTVQLKWTTGSFINSTGGLTGHGDFSYTDYVRVSPFVTRTFNGVGSGGTVFIAFYDKDKVHIGGFAVLATAETIVQVTIPDGAYYARCSNRHSVLANTSVYFEIEDNVRKLITANTLLSKQNLANLIKNDIVWSEGLGFINSTGGITGGSTFSYSNYITVVGGITYLYNGFGSSANVYVAFYDKSQVYIENSAFLLLGDATVKNIIAPETAAFARLSNRQASVPNDQIYFETQNDAANKIKRLDSRITAIEQSGSVEAEELQDWKNEQAVKREIELQKLNDFAWADQNEALFAWISDDLNDEVGAFFDLLTEYGFPMCFAAVEANLGQTDPTKGITKLAIVQQAIARGGELLSHDSAGINGGTKAVQTIEITAGATSDGKLEFGLNGKVIVLKVTNGDTANDIAVALNALAIEEWSSSIAGNVVTFTRDFGGVVAATSFSDPDGTDVAVTITSTESGVDGDGEAAYTKAFVDNKRAFESYGFEVNGIIMAGVTGYNTIDYRKTEDYCRRYFLYSDKFGTAGNEQYRLERFKPTTAAGMIAKIDAVIAAKGRCIFYSHNFTETPEAELRTGFDYLLTKIASGEAKMTNVKYWYDTYKSTQLEKRIKALEL